MRIRKCILTLIFIYAFSTVHIWQTFNALFIIRCLIKYMIETGSEYQLLQHFDAIPMKESLLQNDTVQSEGISVELASTVDSRAIMDTKAAVAKLVDGSKFETFLEALVNIIVVIPVKYDDSLVII